jgi:hypothetical protein
MFQQRSGSPVFRIVSLQVFYKRNRHRPGQKRVFAVGFLRATPTRVSAQIRIRRPHHNSALQVVFALKQIPCLFGFRGGSPANERRVPGFPQSNRLRKLRCRNRMFAAPTGKRRSTLRQAMQPLNVPAAFNSQPWNAGIGSQRVDFLFERQERDNVVYALFHALARILK